jgi:predicted nuclease of predicted toxin-antitoxin system
MNLSPSWVERLAGHGFEVVHWSTIGDATAPDVAILAWANEHHFVVITNDLDFSAILVAVPSMGRASSNCALRICCRKALRASSSGLSKLTVRTSNEARSCRSTRQGRVSECCLSADRRTCRDARRLDSHRRVSPSLVADSCGIASDT